MRFLIRLIMIFSLALLLYAHSFAQVHNRVIYLSEDDAENYELSRKDALLEVVSIEIAGKNITPGQMFNTDENWLKNLKIRVKNISRKPIAYLSLTFQSLKKTDPKSDEYRYSVHFSYDKLFRHWQKNSSLLNPGEEIELTYENISDSEKQAFEKEDVSTVCCATRFFNAQVEFEGGERETYIMILPFHGN